MDPAPPDHHRPKFKLLAPNLSADDHARLTMFVRVAGDRLRGEWNIVSDGNGHLLLLDQEDDATVSGMLEQPVSTMHLSNASNSELAREGILFRPLQYDALIDALLMVEREVLAPEAPAPDVSPAPTFAPTAPVEFAPTAPVGFAPTAPIALAPAPAPAAKAAPLEPTQRVRDDLVRFTQPPATAPSPAQAKPVAELRLKAGDTFRLRRWPATALLKRHRYNGRLASFLSVRHVEMNDLLRLSNVEEAHCLQFLQALHAAGVLDVRRAPPAAPKAASASTPSPTAPAPASRATSTILKPAPVQSGLFAKLRRHLGIA